MHLETSLKRINKIIFPFVVWLLRIVVGGTFIFSGFTKVVDPWGFVFKIQDYLSVWGIDFLWREVIFFFAIGVSIVEFCSGVMVLTGCLRKASVQILAVLMTFMLPLTAYIAIASPVPDCGCFGDALVISNTATFIKNLILTAAIIYLLVYNNRVACLYPPLIQWIVLVVSIAYCLVLGIVGMNVQPMIDFRPYGLGQSIVEDGSDDILLIYEKGSQTQYFNTDSLPDSTWTYVGRATADTSEDKHLAIFSGTEDVTSEVISSDYPQLLLIVTSPDNHKKARAGMANSLKDYMQLNGGEMIGIVATPPDSLELWKKNTNPQYEVYTADDTDLKELVRGDAALVYLVDGKIKWKRTIYSLPADFPEFDTGRNELDYITAPDDGKTLKELTIMYLGILISVFLFGQLRVIRTVKKVGEKKD